MRSIADTAGDRHGRKVARVVAQLRSHRGTAPAGIRRATRGEAGAIAQMINGAFAIEREFIDGDRISVEDVTALIDTGEFLVATTETGRPVGCIYVESRPPTGYIAELAVDRGHREAGIGSRLLAAAEARCRGRGCASVEIRVLNLRAELFPFYRRRGYVECGTEPLSMEAARRARRPTQFIRMKKPL